MYNVSEKSPCGEICETLNVKSLCLPAAVGSPVVTND